MHGLRNLVTISKGPGLLGVELQLGSTTFARAELEYHGPHNHDQYLQAISMKKPPSETVEWGSDLEVEKERTGAVDSGAMVDSAEDAAILPVPDVLPAVRPVGTKSSIEVNGAPGSTMRSPQW